jgi:hypothetical protein
MTGPSEEVSHTDMSHGLLSSPARERIVVLLRHTDDQLANVKLEVSADRRLSVATGVPGLDQVLAPLERALCAAADTLGLAPAVRDGRRALRGMLYNLWANLIDMSPENLGKHWGAHDIPESWAPLHAQLVAAVEGAIAQV